MLYSLQSHAKMLKNNYKNSKIVRVVPFCNWSTSIFEWICVDSDNAPVKLASKLKVKVRDSGF